MRWWLLAAMLPLAGCAFTLSDINSSVTVGRSFDDGRIFDTGRTVWGMTVTGHYVRDRRD